MAITDDQVDEMIEKLRIAFGVETNDDVIRLMVNRFLNWKLPKDFVPDAGISFLPMGEHTSHFWPSGTNLFHSEQAKEMVKHMLGLNNNS